MCRLIVGTFDAEQNVLAATIQARDLGYRIVDVYTPYPVHGLDQAMGLRRSRLGWLCFLFGFVGVAGAFWFQFWTMAWNWPVNVGGKPWNALPAFVPVAFEVMVLCAGLGVVAALMLRSGLIPGRAPSPRMAGVSDDCFALAVADGPDGPGSESATALFHEHHAVRVEYREE
jgi:hypothetical protein